MILCKKKFQSLSEANRISLFRYLTDFNIALSPQINNGINQRSLYFNDSSEQLLDVCCHCRRCNGRLETCNDLALAVDEELREVPLDSVARKVLRKVFLQRVRQHFGQRVRGVKALKALLRRQILKEWLRRIAPHIPLFEDGERNTIVQAAELLHLIVCARLLSCKLVAREAQNLKPLRLILRKDKDARVGHKTADTSFFGYKTHIAMTDERIIAAATVTSGEKSAGAELAALVEKSRKTGLTVKSVIGDTAYSGKKNLALAASEEEPAKGFELIAKLNPVLSDSSREEGVDGFSYNKDAQMFVCPAGHIAIRKVNQAKRGAERNRVLTYHFDIGKCRQCPGADGCYQPGAKSRTYSVSIKSNLHQKQRAFQETEVFRSYGVFSFVP